MPVSIPAVELDLPPVAALALFVIRPDRHKTVQTPCFGSKVLASGGSSRDTRKWPDERQHDAANWPSPLVGCFSFCGYCMLGRVLAQGGRPRKRGYPRRRSTRCAATADCWTGRDQPRGADHSRRDRCRISGRQPRGGSRSSCQVKLRENAKDPDERAYLGYLQGITGRLAGHTDAARATLRAAAAENPTGRWLPKIRFELAAIELGGGNLPVAEELARSEAIRLLSDDRKDRLAEVYHAFARRRLEPDDPVIQPDPKAAWDLLSQARDLAKSPVLRAQLLFAIGRTSQMAGYFPRAIEHFQAYLKEYPGGADRLAARFHLGETQRQFGQPLQARLTWADLVRDIERLKPAAADKDAQSIRARALVEIPSTFGIPNPPDDTSMNLGVAALQRFLSAYPAHPRAVRAAYQIGATYLARGKSDLALAALSRFLKDDGFKVETDQARRDQAELAMTATFQYAQILQGQQKFNEAIAAWKGYLASFPNGPQSADAQRAILDTQLLVAADHLNRARYPEARAAWSEFVAQNPLDPRVPGILFEVGESFLAEKKFDAAIAAWGPLTSKFPGSEPAGHAHFVTASLFETEKGDPAGAIERFKKNAIEPTDYS